MGSHYSTGNCDVMALALNRLTGHKLGIFSGKIPSEDDECGYYFEDAHAVVVTDVEKTLWIDANGEGAGIPDELFFGGEVIEVVLRIVDENEMRSAFTTMDISEESIEKAIEYALNNIEPECMLSSDTTPSPRKFKPK